MSRLSVTRVVPRLSYKPFFGLRQFFLTNLSYLVFYSLHKIRHFLITCIIKDKTKVKKSFIYQEALRRVSVFRVFWSVFSHIRPEYGAILSIPPHSVQRRESTDHKNSCKKKYGHFSRKENLVYPFHNTGLFQHPLRTSENL